MQRHARKMLEKARKCQVIRKAAPGQYLIRSTSGETYLVDAHETRCACRWQEFYPRTACAHLIRAAWEYERDTHNRTISVWDTEEDAHRQHRPMMMVGDVVATSRAAAA